ncbi:MAG TPA: SAM-dependent methyltransferase [Candidatus Bathyarchaeia archaeon]|nr:SAM-dependent methyltransferase [Candidatus Bathyarchaeia archaeon]
MKVYFVGAGPGDPKLITVRGKELIEDANLIIYAGSLVNPEVLSKAKGKKVDSFGMTLEQTTRMIVDAWKQGLRVVRLHSGDPTIYSAVREQILAIQPYGIDYEIVPGVSSVFASAAALGQQLTGETLVITRPSGNTLAEDQLVELSDLEPTMAIFLGVDKIDTIMRRVRYAPETPASVVYHASWDDQVIIAGTVSDIASKAREAGITKSAIILIGDELSLEGERRSYLYSPKT